MNRPRDLMRHVSGLVDAYGSYRRLAEITGVDATYLYRLAAGLKTDPSDDVLHRLCIRRVVVYESYGGILGQPLPEAKVRKVKSNGPPRLS